MENTEFYLAYLLIHQLRSRVFRTDVVNKIGYHKIRHNRICAVCFVVFEIRIEVKSCQRILIIKIRHRETVI